MLRRDFQTDIKQYKVVLKAGAQPVNICAWNPSRNFLEIDCVGVANMKFWFHDSADVGQAIVLAPGAYRIYDVVCPITGLWVQAQGAGDTVVAILEGLVTSNG